MKLKNKLVLAFVSVGLIILIIGVTVHSSYVQDLIADKTNEQVFSLMQFKIYLLENFYGPYKRYINLMTKDDSIIKYNIKRYSQNGCKDCLTRIRNYLVEISRLLDIHRIDLLDKNKTILVSTDIELEGKKIPQDQIFLPGNSPEIIMPFLYDEEEGQAYSILAVPIKNVTDNLDYTLIMHLNLNELKQIIANHELNNLNETDFIVDKNGKIIFSSHIKLGTDFNNNPLVHRCLSLHDNGSVSYLNKFNQKIRGIYVWLPELEGCLITEYNEQNLTTPLLVKELYFSIILGLVLAVMIIVSAHLTSLSLTKPLEVLGGMIRKIGKNQFNIENKVKTRDEFFYLGDVIKRMAQNLEEYHKKLREQNNRIKKDYKRLKELDKAKDQFMMLASHELKTPLITVIGYIDMMLNGDLGRLNKEQTKILKVLYDNTNELSVLINNLLDVIALENNKLKLNKKITNIIRLTKQVIDRNKDLIVKNNAKVKLKFKAKVNANCDPDRIRFVLDNLLKNAILSRKKDLVNHILIEIEKVKNNIKISIKDEGVGMSKELLRNIFKIFYTTNIQSSQYQGARLGLYLSKKLIELHGGKIIIKSKEGEGTNVTITIPGIKKREVL